MTRRDFMLISEVLAEARPSDWRGPKGRDWRDLVTRFARALTYINPRFDAGRFQRACEED